MEVPESVAALLRDPVSLDPIGDLNERTSSGFLEFSVGEHTAKNLAELGFAADEYTEPDGRNYIDRLPHMEHPAIGSDDVVVDIGCGPRSFLDGLPGHHVFVDDLIGAYVEQLGATFDGVAINARSEILPFEDASIDVIYSINMLDHVDDLPETLLEVHRVLAADGVLVLQTYFNSHPLLHSEPGVIDRFAYDTLMAPYFHISELRTHEVQSPEISSYYTMGIMTAHLRPREVVLPVRNRSKYAEPGYLGPQSTITEALDSIAAEEWDKSRQLIERLDGDEFYRFHSILLEAKLAIAEDELGAANDWLKAALAHPRGHRNPYARIAVKELELERLRHAVGTQSARTAEARDGIDRRDSRIDELESAIRQRDKRIRELDGAIVRRDLRIANLERTVALRGKSLLEAGSPADATTIEEFDERIRDLGASAEKLMQRLEDLEPAQLPSTE